MRKVYWCKRWVSILGENYYTEDYYDEITEEIHKINPDIRITEMAVDTYNPRWFHVDYEILLEAENGKVIAEDRLIEQAERDIEKIIKKHNITEILKDY